MAACGNAISTVGCKLYIDATTPGTADVEVKGFDSIGFSGLEATEIETTAMCDTEKQFINGLLDLGTCSVGVNPDYTDAGQNDLRAEVGSTTVKTFKITLANADDIDFTAIVRTNSTDMAKDSKVEGSFDLRIKSRPQVTASGGSALNL